MPSRQQSQRKLRERAEADLQFFKTDTLSAVNAERESLGYPQIERLTYAIEGHRDCYKSETLLVSRFKEGLSSEELQGAVTKSGSTCTVTDNDETALEALVRCLQFGNSDMSLYDNHRTDTTLLYVTWTDMPE